MVLSQQELGNPVGKAFANRVGVFANSSKLLAKHVFPVVIHRVRTQKHSAKYSSTLSEKPFCRVQDKKTLGI
jgi:hypothetical protein